MKKIILIILFLPTSIFSNDTVSVMSYNLLFYDAVPQVRDTNFRKVISFTNPDILLVQEINFQNSVNNFLNSVMNYYTPGLYASGQYINGPDWDVAVFYKQSLFELMLAFPIQTTGRNIMGYQFRHKKTDKIFFVFGLHLKAGNSETDRNLRNQEASALRSLTNTLSPESFFFVCGDFNIYGDWEPAYQTLTSISDSTGAFYDPYTLPGTWNNFIYRNYHSQSTRTRSFGGGATGGLDDRFDFFLNSYSVTQPGGIEYITNSSIPIGNDGNHYNDSINKRPNSSVPDSIADALHYGSDHLPVVAKYIFHDSTVSISNNNSTVQDFYLYQNYPNPFNPVTQIEFYVNKRSLISINLYDVRGRFIKNLATGIYQTGIYSVKLNSDGLSSGIYYYQLSSENGNVTRKMVLKK